jgi:surface antigen
MRSTWHRLRLAAGVAAFAITVGALLPLCVPGASADTGGYPYASVPCVYSPYATTGSGYWCSGYNWGTIRNSTANASELSPYGYDYRNCTDYVAWKLASLGVQPAQYKGLGNASTWGTLAAKHGVTNNASPAVGSVAVNTTAAGGLGHVAFVYAVSGSQISVSEYNLHRDGNYTPTETGTPAQLGFSSFDHFEKYEAPGSSGGATGGPPTMVGKPAALVNRSYSHIDVFYRDTNGDLEDASWSDTPAGYTVHEIASGIAGNPVAIVNTSYSQIDVFYRDTNGDLEDASWSDTPAGYTVHEITPGIVGDPYALVNGSYSQINVFYQGSDGDLWDASWSDTPAGYTTHEITSGIAGNPAAVANSSYSQIDVFYRDTNGDLADASWSDTPAGYTTHEITPGIVGDPSALVNGSYSQIDVFYQGSDGDLWDASWSDTPAGYTTHEITPGIVGDPVAIVNGNYSNIDVFFEGTGGQADDAGWSATSARGYQTQALPTQ